MAHIQVVFSYVWQTKRKRLAWKKRGTRELLYYFKQRSELTAAAATSCVYTLQWWQAGERRGTVGRWTNVSCGDWVSRRAPTADRWTHALLLVSVLYFYFFILISLCVCVCYVSLCTCASFSHLFFWLRSGQDQNDRYFCGVGCDGCRGDQSCVMFELTWQCDPASLSL